MTGPFDWAPKVINRYLNMNSNTFGLDFVDYVNFVIKFVTIIQPDKENEFKTKLSDEKLRDKCQKGIKTNLEDKKFQKTENLIDIMVTHILTKDENRYTDDSLKFFTELTLKYMDIMDKSKSEDDVGRIELLIGYMESKGVDLNSIAEHMDEVSRKKFKELRINQPFFEINMYAALQSREIL